MLPDWRKVNRLLVACSFEQAVAVDQLQPVMQMLSQSLPQARIAVLTSETAGYTFQQETPQQHFSPVEIIDQLRERAFDAAIIFTMPFQSCYTIAYLCYLSGIPIRVGQSLEFGGALLSQSVKLSLDSVPPIAHHLHLIDSINLSTKRLFSTSL